MKAFGIRHLMVWSVGFFWLVHGFAAWGQSPPTLETVCSVDAGALPVSPGTTPLTPGRWWNPARGGTGWDIHFGPLGEQGQRVFFMTWFSYDVQGRPTWYVAHGDDLLPGQQLWQGQLSQVRWDFQTQSRTALLRRGDIRVRFQPSDASRLAIEWKLDGQTVPAAGFEVPECLRDFGIAAQGEQPPSRNSNSVTPAYSGAWTAEQLESPYHQVGSWSLMQTVLAFTINGSTVYRESAVLTTFDDTGEPVWLDATDQSAPEPIDLALGVSRTLPYSYYYVTPTEYPNGRPNTACSLDIGCSRRQWLPPDSTWTRTFLAPSTCGSNSCMTGSGRPIVQIPATAPSHPTAQAITRLLPASEPVRGLRKISDLDVIHVDKVLCPADTSANCQVSVTWASADPWARVRRVRLPGSTGPSASVELIQARHGSRVETLRAGDLVRFELTDWSGTVLHSTPSVEVKLLPLRIQNTQAQLSSTVAPSNIRLSAEVYGGTPPLQVEYFVDNRSLGVTGDGTPHFLQWNAVGPGTYTVTFEVRDSSSTAQILRQDRQVTVSAPAPASSPTRTVVDQASDGVGTLPGAFRVDESGAATYAIPLTLPPGRAGVTPSLGLQYSSQGGESSLGRGWSLSGLSNITRCRKTRESGDFNVQRPGETYFEDFDGIQFTDEDAFCLDGQRLVNAASEAKSGCPAVAGHGAVEMRTEVDSQQRVCAYRSDSLPNIGPRAFSVESKDGQRRWYGLHNGQGQPSTPASIELPVLTSGPILDSPIYLWALNRSRDSLGNYIDYQYIPDTAAEPIGAGPERTGALLIHSIQYAGRESPSAVPHSEVRFTYQSALQNDYFVSGRRFSTSRQLQHIDALDSGILQRRYELAYLSLPFVGQISNDGRLRHLQSLQECAPENPGQPEGTQICLRPTRFNYGGSDPDSTQPQIEHAGLDIPFGTAVNLGQINIGSVSKFEGKKIADIDGDGLLDIVWVKDKEGRQGCDQAPTAIDPTALGTDVFSVAFLRHVTVDATRKIQFENKPAFCTPVELMNRTWEHGTNPDESWFLYDYNRDGKSDLFFRGSAYWHGFLATGNPEVPFDIQTDILHGSNVLAGAEVKYFPRPVDLNADGLMDLVRVQDIRGVRSMRARIFRTLQKGSKPEDSGWATEIPVTYASPCGADLTIPDCSATLVGLFDEDGFERQIDLNGDGTTDLFVSFDVTASWPPSSGGDGEGPGGPGYDPIHAVRGAEPNVVGTRRMMVGMRVTQVGADGIRLEPVSGMWRQGGIGRYTQHVDLNGDGLTDSVSLLPTQASGFNGFSLNSGGVDKSHRLYGKFRCILGADRSPGLADINGDGLPDFYAFEGDLLTVNLNTGGNQFRVVPSPASGCTTLFSQQLLHISGTGTDPARLRTWHAGTAQPDVSKRELLFGDWDGDGLTDLLVLVFGGDADLYLSHIPRMTSPALPRAVRRADPPGLLTAITDGLGGRTEITYRPLSHPAVYRVDRTTNDAAYGRGSAVHDVRAAINVVAKVETSAPGLTHQARKAQLYYRYVGAKMQSGGRGLLGFREIHTIDPNHSPIQTADSGAFALTITSYRQQFPFIGLPETTERWVVREPWQESACFLNTAPCADRISQAFPTPDEAWPARARLLSDATEDYVFVWTSSPSVERDSFDGQNRGPEPVQVRRIRSEEHTYDLHTGVRLNASVQLYRYIADNGVADPFGNVLRTRSFVFANSPTPTPDGQDYSNYESRVETLNTYQNDIAATHWYPGRLTKSRVSHRRSGPDGAEIVRVSEFGYGSSGSQRGLLMSETAYAESARVWPQTAANEVPGLRDERLNTFHRYDAYGNRTGTYTCDASIAESTCRNRSSQSFNIEGSPLYVHRWSEVTYTADGRFVRYTESPYANGVRRDSEVLAHTAYGQPLLVRGLNGGYTRYAYGRFGRSAYQWTQTVAAKTDPLNGGNAALGQGPGLALGVESRTHYAWCSAAGGSADCPTGAVYRQTSEGTEQPRQWSYFDQLARPVLQVSELVNADTANGQRRSGACSDYDAQGRGFRQSVPRMLLGSDTPNASELNNFCGGAPSNYWTETRFDVLGRSILQWSPEENGRAETKISYEGLVIRTTLPNSADGLLRQRIEERNVLGELVRVQDAEQLGAEAVYAYNATGDLMSVTRDASDGSTADSRMYYDRMGRKVRSLDPDAGVWNYRYNAAGDMIAQYDGSYVQPSLGLPTNTLRTTQQFDGRGRLVRKRSYAVGSSTQQVAHDWRYDTSWGGLSGSLAGVLSDESSVGSYVAGQEGTVDFKRTHHYDDLGRPIGSATVMDGQSVPYRAAAHYDSRGRIWKTMDASLRWLKTEYGARSFALAQCESLALDTATGCGVNHEHTHMRVTAADAFGNVIREQRGSGLEVSSTYAPSSGRLSQRCTRASAGDSNCSLQLDSYNWDPLGNLLWRERRVSMGPYSSYPRYRETFSYDSLNRVTAGLLGLYTSISATTASVSHTSLNMAYDALGNVCQRSVNGNTLYMHYLGSASCNGAAAPQDQSGAAGFSSPHALTRATSSVGSGSFTAYAYDAHGNQTRALNTGGTTLPPSRTVEYTVEQQAWRMLQGSEVSRFYYGPDGARYKRVDQGNGATTRTHYVGNVEVLLKNATPSVRRYVAGVAMMEVNALNTVTLKRLVHDHLGSVSMVISGTASTVLERYDYDAFGQRRAALGDPRGAWSWNANVPPQTNRGYTGHEMLDAYGLVHMNGRIYDSRTARFLQADPFVQEPNNPQNFNRYTYLWNNPLNATDPSGYLGVKERQWAATVLTVVAVALQQYGVASALKGWGVVAYYAAVGAASGGIATQSWNGAMWGAFSGAVSAGLGLGYAQAGSALWEQALLNGASQGMLSSLQGGKFGNAFAAAGLSTLAGYLPVPEKSMGQLVMRTLVGGTVSAATGGKFGNGAISAAMSFAAGRGFGGKRANQVFAKRDRASEGSLSIEDDYRDLSPHDKLEAALYTVEVSCPLSTCDVPAEAGLLPRWMLIGNNGSTTILGGEVTFALDMFDWTDKPYGPFAALEVVYHESMHRVDSPRVRWEQRDDESPRHDVIYEQSHVLASENLARYVKALEFVRRSRQGQE